MLKSQKGSAAVVALVLMLFLTILASASSTIVNSDLRFSKMSSDDIEAQFAAEAGAKHAISMFYQPAQDWIWVDPDVNTANWQTLSNDARRYHVRISLNGAHIVPAAPAAAGIYTITATGNVRNSTKTATVQVTVAGNSGGTNPYVSGDVFGRYGLYSKGNANIEAGNVPVINGDIGFAGGIYINGTTNFLNGNHLHVRNPVPSIGGWRGGNNDWLKNSIVADENVGTLEVTMPELPEMPTIPSTIPGGANKITGAGDFNQSTYYSSSLSSSSGNIKVMAPDTTIYATNGLRLTKSGLPNGTITSTGNLTLYVNGNAQLDNGSFINATGDITIYISGSLDIMGASYIRSETGNVEIITNSYIKFHDNNNYIQAPPGKELNIISRQGNIEFNNNCYMNGGTAFLQAQQNIILRNSGSINDKPGYGNALAYLFSNGSMTEGTFKIGGAASMFITSGPFKFNESFYAPKTIFISESGETYFTRNPNLGGVYVNGSIRIDSKPTITYDSSILTRLGLTGGGGTGSTTVNNWGR
ncbi:pilus assembly PilX N-terminal domain-containing protein [Dendrosporobacter sp. 1207_IL3150]|uniref:pilus assembly PilX N-terminal domain-containing protein n=1 Tax=Dendrosporobacter sp. 1207_IL3150 TaxID=3084054 RepID=UPI002FDA47CF